ncbi:Tyrosine aminotransferase [Melia azedarach]|uniref:Tyrosine aminotransferase n=1 Tax=Melia azedarach TaxID=155640 RepID=A0ACC1Z1Z2_MELAZ|nr:Tyrosine aminotransferase [Melia azedarach]
MENGSIKKQSNQQLQAMVNHNLSSTTTTAAADLTIRGIMTSLRENINKNDPRPTVHLGHGDPSTFLPFRTATVAEDAVVDALRTGNYNCYSTTAGILPARRAVADYLNRDLPYKLSPDDVYMTLGCSQAIEVTLAVLARPGANILMPRPGYPFYEIHASRNNNIEARHFDLLPEEGWEVDLDAVEALADENTVAIVIINPGNPCGNVFSYQHLQKIAETARKLGIVVIADEVYDHLAFGSTPYVPMGVFGSIVPVITLGSISKRWIVPGWRLGWLVTSDPNGILQKSGIVDSIKDCLEIACRPVTFIQGAVPRILEKTNGEFFSNIIGILREAAEICYDGIQEIPFITCPVKAQGAIFVMVKLNVSLLEDIKDDMEFSVKLAKEESVLVLPGIAVGMRNWLRITIAADSATLEDALERIKAFCHRHAKRQ